MQIRAAYLLIDSLAGDDAATSRVLDLVRALHDQGTEVHLVTDGPPDALPPDLLALAASSASVGERPLLVYADVALRDYRVRSGAPVVGRWIAAVRRALTAHVKEEYLDVIVERQVAYNRELAAEVERLQTQVRALHDQVDAQQRSSPSV